MFHCGNRPLRRPLRHRHFVWLNADVLANDSTIVFARDDDYFFGVLCSRIHEIWARAQGTQVREEESGARYTPTTSFETFPLPWPPGQEPATDPRHKSIADAAAELAEKRASWLSGTGDKEPRSLNLLCNARPTWLNLAHAKLDAAVAAAYGWPADLSEEAILERLLSLNQAAAS